MSMQSGVFWFDGREATETEGWDHSEAGVAMAQGSEGVWLSSRSPSRVNRRPALVMTWDGRLDNRDDLLLRLGTLSTQTSDPELALAVFDRFGIDGLQSLIGEWSLVIWDRASRTLHLARDYMGVRPLYYFRDQHGVAWSSDLADIAGRTRRSDMLCAAFAAYFMSVRPSPDLTPYEGILAVPSGTCISIAANGRETRTRVWQLSIGELRYRDRRDYEAHLRALWREALRARLQTDGTVWAELSGGLDSSSVVCMADHLIKSGEVPARAIRLVSHATLHSPEGDERRFIAEVERQVGVRSEIIGIEDHQSSVDPALACETPNALQGVGLEVIRRVRAGGGRLVLSGRLGDAVMGCQPDNSAAVFDDLARGHVLTALRSMRAWSRATKKPFLEIAWWLFAPDEASAPDDGVALLTPSLRCLLQRTAERESLRGVRRAKRALARMVLDYTAGGRLNVPHYPPDIIYTYPFAHRPLVDFVLAIPGEELSAPGMTRALMRRGFENLLPARVLRRVSKGYYPPVAFRALRRQAASIAAVDKLQVVQRGWIDRERLKGALRTLTDGSGETGGDVQRVLRLETWLQARHVLSAIPQRKEVNSDAVLHT